MRTRTEEVRLGSKETEGGYEVTGRVSSRGRRDTTRSGTSLDPTFEVSSSGVGRTVRCGFDGD